MSKTIRIIFLLSILTSIVFCRCDNRHSFVLFVYILMIGCHLDVENQKLASFLQGLWLLCQPLVMASFDIRSSSVARWDGIIRQRFCHHHLLLEQVVIVESSNHFFFFFSSSQSSMIVSLRMSGFLLLLENDYLGGGQGQVAKSCHFFDSNEVKCIHHPISQKSGDFVIYFYYIRSFQ